MHEGRHLAYLDPSSSASSSRQVWPACARHQANPCRGRSRSRAPLAVWVATCQLEAAAAAVAGGVPRASRSHPDRATAVLRRLVSRGHALRPGAHELARALRVLLRDRQGALDLVRRPPAARHPPPAACRHAPAATRLLHRPPRPAVAPPLRNAMRPHAHAMRTVCDARTLARWTCPLLCTPWPLGGGRGGEESKEQH